MYMGSKIKSKKGMRKTFTEGEGNMGESRGKGVNPRGGCFPFWFCNIIHKPRGEKVYRRFLQNPSNLEGQSTVVGF